MIKNICALIIVFTVLWSAAYTQGSLVTDRPDQTESSSTVGKRAVQVETGIVWSRYQVELFNTGPLEKSNDYATTLIRIGVLDRAELRFATAYSKFDSGIPFTPIQSGLQPLSIGVKFNLTEEKGAWPEVAFLGHVTLPWIGDDAFVPDYIAPDFRFSLSHTLSDRFSLGYNFGMFWDGFDARANFLYTIALGATLIGPVCVFAELYGEVPEKNEWRHNADFGLTILLTPDLQLDASYGKSLKKRFEEHFFNVGVSFRFASHRVVERQ
jgi:hypothetical protein